MAVTVTGMLPSILVSFTATAENTICVCPAGIVTEAGSVSSPVGLAESVNVMAEVLTRSIEMLALFVAVAPSVSCAGMVREATGTSLSVTLIVAGLAVTPVAVAETETLRVKFTSES